MAEAEGRTDSQPGARTGADAGPIAPGGTVGILGGGQLGRMLALAAARLGLKTAIYAPEAEGPAQQVAAWSARGAFDDAAALDAFAARVDVITFEFENTPAAPLRGLANRVPIRPNLDALETAQDRLAEKTRLTAIGAGVAPYVAIDGSEGLVEALNGPDAPAQAILKTRRFGYDGKGQVRLSAGLDRAGAEAAWAEIGGQPAVLETRIAFEREISVICARGLDGTVRCYDPAENRHADGILRRSSVPAAISAERAAEATALATRLAEALDYVGVMGVEMFDPGAGAPLLVNEFAPRVHNTGHWTLEACAVSQFEQHIRAVCGWPLGDPVRHSDAEMDNLLGEEALGWEGRATDPGEAVHLYGKAEARAGRKMGHVTRVRARSA
ncbi:MAG: 5-(carboxyamino)imidazole ribonucleotide synthase [Pseudomonadota bacterium]